MYKLSKDYKHLYNLICNGYIVAGFVDYTIREAIKPYRDIVKIERREPYYIDIGVRGISYGSVHKFMEKEGEEETIFIKHCKKADPSRFQNAATEIYHIISPSKLGVI